MGPRYYPIHGVKTSLTGDIHQASATSHPRLDIDELSSNPAHAKGWSLFLQALTNLKGYAETEPLGYFGVAGIHGYPHIAWMSSPGGDRNYCAHASALFLPWHRAYMLLFEQRIVEEALLVAEGYDDKAAYLAEARKLRVPYWDWAKDAHLPRAVLDKVAYVQGKSGKLKEIENPLYSYKWQDKSPLSDGFPFKETKRCPDKRGNSQPDVAYQQLNILAGLRTGVYDAITKTRDYRGINSTGQRGYAFESVHDNLHGLLGTVEASRTRGEMSDPGVAAFDPIFWLHHSSIDRYFALWQELHRDAVFQPNLNRMKLTVDTPLLPFSTNSNGDMWTSGMVQKAEFDDVNKTTYEFGYHYPETRPELTQKERQDEVLITLINLYSPGATAAAEAAAEANFAEPERAAGEGVEEMDESAEEATEEPDVSQFMTSAVISTSEAAGELSVASAAVAVPGEFAVEAAEEPVSDLSPPSPLLNSLFPFFISLIPILGPLLHMIMFPPGTLSRETYDTTLPSAPTPPEGLPVEAGLRREWKVFYEIKRYIVDNNFTLFFFLGDPDDSPDAWSTSPNAVGSYCSFKANVITCGNCQTNRELDMMVYGEVNLTAQVLSRLPTDIQLHDQEAISDWLSGKLHWRLRKDDGTEFSGWEAGSLLVGVESYMEAHPPAFSKGETRTYELRDIVGVTFDTQRHPTVTEKNVEMGGYVGEL